MFKKTKKSLLFPKLFLTLGILFLGNLVFIKNVSAATYYVRPDGGTAEQCTGLVDAPYPGSGTGQACAFNHPFEATGLQKYKTQILQGGDTLLIKNGSYRMGRTVGVYEGNGCADGTSGSCVMKALPSGPDEDHPTRILGEGWDVGCSSPPELWATERAQMIIDLTNSSNVEVQCLELTDHETCGANYKKSWVGSEDGGPDLACNLKGTTPLGDFGYHGIFSGVYNAPYNTSENVLLKNLYIHGLGGDGINASHLKDWNIENCKINFNAKGGFDGDTSPSKGLNDEFSGVMNFNNVEIKWNGCIEDWQHPDDPDFLANEACYDKENGGYGDGIGTGPIGNAQWIFKNVTISHNTSDGLDLLYAKDYPNSSVIVKNSRFEGNVGNQIKVSQSSYLENNEIIGNCDFFADKNYKEASLPTCRGGGAAYINSLSNNAKSYLLNNSFIGTGPMLFGVDGSDMQGNEMVYSINNLMYGLKKYNSATDNSDYYYIYNMADLNDFLSNHWVSHHNLYYNTVRKRYDQCLEVGSVCDIDPLIQIGDAVNDIYDLRIDSGSGAIDRGLPLGTIVEAGNYFFGDIRTPSIDFLRKNRMGNSDIGAYEYLPSIRADVDQNSTINSIDAMLTLRNSLGLDMSQTNWFSSTTTGDVNCDGTTNSTDAMLILRHSLGLDMNGTGWCED